MSTNNLTKVYFKLPHIPKQSLVSMNGHDFNSFRCKNDYPIIVDFLLHYLPHFQKWIDSQKYVTYDCLIKHGPARLLRESKRSYIFDRETEEDPYITVISLLTGEHGPRKFLDKGKCFHFTPYFSWIKKNYGINPIHLENGLKPNPYTPGYIEVNSKEETLKNCTLVLELRDLSNTILLESQYNCEFTNLENTILSNISSTIIWYSYAFGLKFKNNGYFHDIYKTTLSLPYLADPLKQDRKVEMSDGNYQSIKIIDSPIKLVLKNSSMEYCQIWDDHTYIHNENSIIRNCFFDHSYNSLPRHIERVELHSRMKEMYSGIGKVVDAGKHHYKMKSQYMLSLKNPKRIDQPEYSMKTKFQRFNYSSKCYFSLIFHFISKIFWGFGEHPWRIWMTSIFINLILSSVYYFSPGSSTYKLLPNSISYSLYSFVNINKPNLVHSQAWIDVLSSAQGFLGLLCIGIFISALSSKVREY
ncbi:hypothetical protein [Vibrio parahaemolyticus]|uniref:hypothetical protein n=3 Tax=Vibrio parahaemolyticus TaxID=670 RepID=UPI001121B730|nr:hypothetical protein [Vibrio parahaemolyticus]